MQNKINYHLKNRAVWFQAKFFGKARKARSFVEIHYFCITCTILYVGVSSLKTRHILSMVKDLDE